ncbi:CDP-alcohol phosphatidyltransferase family protein [Leptolyngbya sp. 15MV]|nr:CDP-alcohol phosphatidyltransferase family protein [Leptolyngbya sp. 15MV]
MTICSKIVPARPTRDTAGHDRSEATGNPSATRRQPERADRIGPPFHTFNREDPQPVPTDLHRVLPNAITVARLVMATGVFVLLSLQPYHARARAQALHDPDLAQAAPLDWLCLLAAGLFALAALSDALDGLLARRWNAITPFGRVMDPMADKILVLGAFILLAGPGFTDLATGRRRRAGGVAEG